MADRVALQTEPANSPYVAEEEKNAINQAAMKNSKARDRELGCIESVYGELPTSSVNRILKSLVLTSEVVSNNSRIS